MIKISKTLLTALTVTALAVIGIAGTASAADKTKVGFVYVGPIGDHGWTYRHDIGRKAIESQFGDKVETTYVESVPEGADAERVLRQMAASGHDLIFTTSFGYMNPTVKVAKDFPNIRFEHATGYKRADNVSTYSGRFYEGRYISGLIAGHMTKSNIIGYVGSFPIPEVVRGINAFTLGLRKVNPKAEVKVVWVSTWYDPGKEADAAKALLDQGADVMLQHTDSPAPLQIAEERGLVGIGQASDMSKFAPKAQLTGIIDDWSPYYIKRTQAVMDGSWKSEDTWHGLKEGMVVMAPYNKSLPDNVVAQAEEARKAIESGSLKPFTGPIKDQSGKEILAAGKSYDDGTLLKMDFYVEGVQGKLPK